MRVLVAALTLILILAANPTIVEDAVLRTDDMLHATAGQLRRWAGGIARTGSLPQPDTTAAFVLVGFAVAIRAVWQARRPRDIEYRFSSSAKVGSRARWRRSMSRARSSQ